MSATGPTDGSLNSRTCRQHQDAQRSKHHVFGRLGARPPSMPRPAALPYGRKLDAATC